MKSIKIPLEFLKAIGDKEPPIRIYWVKWLADYTDHLFKSDFMEIFLKDMEGKKLNLKTIKEAYDFGMPFFKDGFVFISENKRSVIKKITDDEKEIINKVIEHLNTKSNSTYTTSKANADCIHARINEGYTISDFKRVIDSKVEQWLGTEQEKYLRPITLFQAKKFENYLNEPQNTKNANRKPTSAIDKLTSASEKAKRFFQ
jgi:uncharacterized phage protein (TIGR02220 family)